MPAEVWLDVAVKAPGLLGQIGIRQIVYRMLDRPGQYVVEYVLPFYRGQIWRVPILVNGDQVPLDVEKLAMAELCRRAFGGNG